MQNAICLDQVIPDEEKIIRRAFFKGRTIKVASRGRC